VRFPPDFTFPEEKTVTAHVAAQAIAGLVTERRAVVQAGGCSGLWPLALSQYFERVYTFEPAPSNFPYLSQNIAGKPSITAYPVALGETPCGVALVRTKPKAGLWRVDGDGETPMVRLDAVVAEPVDAIVLDVEGSELPALRGAERLIAAHRPLLWFEFMHDTDALSAFMAAHGYTPPVHAIGGDCYSVHASRVA
jgi:FkbM family methyltransferase